MSLDFFGHADADIGTRVRYSVTNLARAQAALGDRPTLHLLASGPPRRLAFEGVDVHLHRCLQPPRRLGLRWRFARQLSVGTLGALRRGSADVVHFHGARQLHGMFAAVAWRAEREDLPLVAQERGFRIVGRLESLAQAYGLARSRAVLAATPEGVEALRELGVPEHRLHLVPNGFDPGSFRPEERPPPRAPLRVLTVSRLEEAKDPVTAAAGVVELARRGRDVELTVVGAGSLRPAVERVLRDGGVRARFLDGVPQVELGSVYAAADAFLLTSSYGEGWTQAVLEAMACGLPVVSTDVAGPRDVLGGAGSLVPVRDPAAVADALQRLADDPVQWGEQRALGLDRAQGFTWDAVARRVRAAYLDALDERRPSRAPTSSRAERRTSSS